MAPLTLVPNPRTRKAPADSPALWRAFARSLARAQARERQAKLRARQNRLAAELAALCRDIDTLAAQVEEQAE